MILQEIRDAVLAQLDMDTEELPNETLDLFIQDGYNRMIQMEQRWPFFQERWTLDAAADTVAYDRDPTIASIVSIYDLTGRYRLNHIDHGIAEDAYGDGSDTSGTPAYWSEWGGQIYLWPTPTDVRSYQIRGYRKPTDWVGAEGEVDADERLHIALVYFACALAYAQQEDEVLEGSYLQRFFQTVEMAREDVMRNSQQWRPVIMSGGVRPPAYTQIVIDVP